MGFAGIGKQNVSYIVDLSSLDSLVSCEYFIFMLKNRVESIILHKPPKDDIQKESLNNLQGFIDKSRLLDICNTEIEDEIPMHTKNIICGAPLTRIYKSFIINPARTFNTIVIAGGHVPTFSDKEYAESTLLNSDIVATDKVLKSLSIENTVLVGSNITDDPLTYSNGWIWRDNELALKLIKKYDIPNNLPLPILTACHDGIANFFTSLGHNSKYKINCIYDKVIPCYRYSETINNYEWSCNTRKREYMSCIAAVKLVTPNDRFKYNI